MPTLKKAFFHLPGLFEFYELYRLFLPIFREHREYFYEWCEIGSLYGAPADCLWGGGRLGGGTCTPQQVLALTRQYGLSARLTFSNSLLRPSHLNDPKCNELCALFAASGTPPNGVIVHSDLLKEYLKTTYPSLYLISSTTKVLTDFNLLVHELNQPDFKYVVPDFRLNKAWDQLEQLTAEQTDKMEFLCNECCWLGCNDRRACYENVSRQNLGEECPDYICMAPGGNQGYKFSSAMEHPAFIGLNEIQQLYLPRHFSNFKIEGRGLGTALILEFLLYYLTKPKYHLKLREAIYLDNTLDLF